MTEHIRSFDSPEEAIEHIRQTTAAALARALPQQLALADGKKHYWIRLLPVMGEEMPLIITGWTHDVEAQYAELREHYKNDPETLEELAWEQSRVPENLANGYVSTQAFSAWEPRGEIGDVHVSVMAETTEEVFEILKAHEFSWWGNEDAYTGAEFTEVVAAIGDFVNNVAQQMGLERGNDAR